MPELKAGGTVILPGIAYPLSLSMDKRSLATVERQILIEDVDAIRTHNA
jgi:hypothetical protein